MEEKTVIGFGEVLIDFTPIGEGPMGNPALEMNTGGGPLNCMAAVAALGGKTEFIGMVGNDIFADEIEKSVRDAKVGCQALLRTEKAPTTLAFVAIDEIGERKFSFIRNPGADLQIAFKDIDVSMFNNAAIFHFSGLALTSQPAKDTALQLAQYARERGILVSYDPNYRKPLWADENLAIDMMKKGIEYADIVKISDYEADLLFGSNELQYEEAIEKVLRIGASHVLLTCGKDGAYCSFNDEISFQHGYKIDAVDTTGCGDAFLGAYLYSLLYEKMDLLERAEFANRTAAICAMKRGGLPAMPTKLEVDMLALK